MAERRPQTRASEERRRCLCRPRTGACQPFFPRGRRLFPERPFSEPQPQPRPATRCFFVPPHLLRAFDRFTIDCHICSSFGGRFPRSHRRTSSRSVARRRRARAQAAWRPQARRGDLPSSALPRAWRPNTPSRLPGAALSSEKAPPQGDNRRRASLRALRSLPPARAGAAAVVAAAWIASARCARRGSERAQIGERLLRLVCDGGMRGARRA